MQLSNLIEILQHTLKYKGDQVIDIYTQDGKYHGITEISNDGRLTIDSFELADRADL